MSKPIQVAAAKDVAEQSDCTHVVIVGFDEREPMFQCATFGLRDERDKFNAAAMGEHVIAFLGGLPLAFPPHDDFRNPLKKQIADARAIAKRLRDLPPNGSKSWTGAECDALAELCDVLGVETE